MTNRITSVPQLKTQGAPGWEPGFAIGPTQLIYQQGGGAPGTYTSFALALAAAVASLPAVSTILIDGSVAQPVMSGALGAFPAGLTIKSRFLEENEIINIQDGCSFSITDNLVLDGVTLNNQAVASVPCPVAAAINVTLRRGSEIISDAAARQSLFAFSGTASSAFVLDEVSVIGGLSTALPFSNALTGGALVAIVLDGNSKLGAASLAGAGNYQVDVTDVQSSYIPTGQTATSITVLGGSALLSQYVALVLSAAGGAQTIGARPATKSPAFFLGQPSGNQASSTTYTLPVGGVYQPNDIIRILFTVTQLAAANVIVVDGGAGTPTIDELYAAGATAVHGSAWGDYQLNAAGTHWIFLGGGYH